MPRTCGCPPVNPQVVAQKRLRYRRFVRAQLEEEISASTVFIGIRYRILYRNSSENVSKELIEAQHQSLVACFNQANTDRSSIPSSGRYNFASVMGNPDIVFLPVNYADLQENREIERIAVPSNVTFGGSSPLLSILTYLESRSDVETVVDGILNVFIAPLENQILGQAYLESNTCCIHYETIGGPLKVGSLTNYHLGKTLVHEAGHCLGLPHTFGSCSSQPFSDIPKQLNPNYYAVFIETGGAKDGALCNRYRDCKIYKEGDNTYRIPGQEPPYSCFGCETTLTNCTSCNTDLYEQFMNFLDYGNDEIATGFSGQQATYMHDFLLSGQSIFTLMIGSGTIPVVTSAEDINKGTLRNMSVLWISVLSVLWWLTIGIALAYFIWRYKKTT